jgi:[ribosomal protein S5]-alanine N-acetyltransferase
MLPMELTSRRLLFRAPRASDARHIYDAYTQKPEVSRYMIWRPHTSVSQSDEFIAQRIAWFDEGARRPYILALREAPDNANSARALEKAGFNPEPRPSYMYARCR